MSDNQRRLTLVALKVNSFLRLRKLLLSEKESERLTAGLRSLQAEDKIQEWTVVQDWTDIPDQDVEQFLQEWT